MANKQRSNKRSDTSAKSKARTMPRRTKKKDTKGIYKGVAYESLEELAFLQWASEAQKAGFILSIERADPYLLCKSLVHDYAVNLKTKSKPATQTLLHGHSYTPEFVIRWNKHAIDKFVWVPTQSKKFEALFVGYFEEGVLSCVIEVKPMFDQNNMERLFKVNQKWMWEKYGVFVNLVKPQRLFQETFTPSEYRTTPSGRPRVIKWTQKSLSQFISNR
jgi:hypothetical protein